MSRVAGPGWDILDVVIISGQSNAPGRADVLPQFPVNQFMWSNSIGITSPAPTDIVPLGPYQHVTWHGIELALCELLVKNGLTPFFFKVGEDATSLLSTWLPPSAPGWTTLVADFATALAKIRAKYPRSILRYHFLWIQGENEAGLTLGDPEVAAYAGRCGTLIAGIRDLTGVGTNCHFHIIRLHTIAVGSFPSLADMQAQQDAAQAAIVNAHIYSTNYTNLLHYVDSDFNIMAADVCAGIVSTL
jgi:hypothetical protein